MIPGPRRERRRLPTATLNSKGKEENKDLSSTIHRRRDEVIPLNKVLGSVLPEIELAKCADNIVTPD